MAAPDLPDATGYEQARSVVAELAGDQRRRAMCDWAARDRRLFQPTWRATTRAAVAVARP